MYTLLYIHQLKEKPYRNAVNYLLAYFQGVFIRRDELEMDAATKKNTKHTFPGINKRINRSNFSS